MNKSIVLIGLKGSGKTTIARALAEKLARPFLDTDKMIEDDHSSQTGKRCDCRAIYQTIGEQAFRKLEADAIHRAAARETPSVIATGGSSMLDAENAACFVKSGLIVYLDAGYETLLARWKQSPPVFVDPDNLAEALQTYCSRRAGHYQALAHFTVKVDELSIDQIVDKIQALTLLDTQNGR
jgi:shikimate kinase